VDTVIVCAGQLPLRTLYDELVAAGVKATLVGGAFEARSWTPSGRSTRPAGWRRWCEA
jgi:hypothetical protein